MIANSLSVVLILFYFTSTFNFGAGLALSSPVQWVAVARQAALAVVFVRLFVSVRKKKAAPVDRKVELEPKIKYGDTLRDVPA
jgi:lipoprotein signal peptidase